MPSVEIYDDLMTAIHQHNATEVGVLLEQWLGDVNDHLLNCAIDNNDPDIVALLAPRAVGEHRDGVIYAVELGHLECVQQIIPYCSEDDVKGALCHAVINGRMSLVEYLAGQCDVKSSHALFDAILYQEFEIFELLFPLSDPWRLLDETRKHFQEGPPNDHERKCIAWFEQRMAEEQRKTLLNEIPDTTVVRASKL